MAKWQVNQGYSEIARSLVAKFQELRHINVGEIIFVDNVETGKSETTGRRPRRSSAANPNRKASSRVVYANTRKIPRIVTAIMLALFNAPQQYIIEIMKLNCMNFSREQLVALIYHELRHIDQGGGLLKHDIEDWSNMTATFGTNWGATQKALPNLLADDFNWSQFDGPQLQMFKGGKSAAAAGEGR